jgi:hypothetical protein
VVTAEFFLNVVGLVFAKVKEWLNSNETNYYIASTSRALISEETALTQQTYNFIKLAFVPFSK